MNSHAGLSGQSVSLSDKRNNHLASSTTFSESYCLAVIKRLMTENQIRPLEFPPSMAPFCHVMSTIYRQRFVDSLVPTGRVVENVHSNHWHSTPPDPHRHCDDRAERRNEAIKRATSPWVDVRRYDVAPAIGLHFTIAPCPGITQLSTLAVAGRYLGRVFVPRGHLNTFSMGATLLRRSGVATQPHFVGESRKCECLCCCEKIFDDQRCANRDLAGARRRHLDTSVAPVGW